MPYITIFCNYWFTQYELNVSSPETYQNGAHNILVNGYQKIENLFDLISPKAVIFATQYDQLIK